MKESQFKIVWKYYLTPAGPTSVVTEYFSNASMLLGRAFELKSSVCLLDGRFPVSSSVKLFKSAGWEQIL